LEVRPIVRLLGTWKVRGIVTVWCIPRVPVRGIVPVQAAKPPTWSRPIAAEQSTCKQA
jgi:hypothetical protein